MKYNALVVGINRYSRPENNLSCCVNDAEKVGDLLEYDYNENRRFSVLRLYDEKATYDNIMKDLKKVFVDDCDIGVFYFSGHGYDDENDGRLCTYDFDRQHMGMRFRDILEVIEKSKCKNKIIILDCCHSGKMGNFSMIGDNTMLKCGTTILTACDTNEYSLEDDQYSLFNILLIESLEG